MGAPDPKYDVSAIFSGRARVARESGNGPEALQLELIARLANGATDFDAAASAAENKARECNEEGS